MDQAQAIPPVIRADELQRRRDFRSYDIVTIDGETARDFDDAVWVERLENGNYALHVHIADVSHYVLPGTPIDEEARLRGTSVYFPDRAVPMLPLELSTEICSLKPGVDRLVLSALLEIDHAGDVVRAGVYARGDSQRRAHDLHGCSRAARRRRGVAGALREAGAAVRADAGAGAGSESQAGEAGLHRFRHARAAHRVRRIRADDRRDPRAAQHRPPPDRGVHAGGERSGSRPHRADSAGP